MRRIVRAGAEDNAGLHCLVSIVLEVSWAWLKKRKVFIQSAGGGGASNLPLSWRLLSAPRCCVALGSD